jgi:hypothetical protein
MSSRDRRAAARRRAWGRGPVILRFEPLEGRQLMASGAALPDLVATSFNASPGGDWGQKVQVSGTIANIGTAALPTGAVVAIYASPMTVIGSTALSLGTATIAAGLAPGATEPFSTTVVLPPSPLSGMGMNSQLFLDIDIDPQNLVAEASKGNNQAQGLGLDETIVAITPQPVANLIGTAFDLSSPSTAWGQSISVTAQIKDNGQGPAPATRAKIVLTPYGQAPGGAGDITVGNIAVPALLPFQTVNLVQQVNLPATPPNTLGNAGAYTISMIQDADHLTSPLVQQVTMQGPGLDESTLSIPYPTAAAPTSTTTTAPDGTTTTTTTSPSTTVFPDLAPTSITLPTTTLNWGQGYLIDTSVQNLGQAASTPTMVAFYLTGDNANPSQGYFLGETAIPALAAGGVQQVAQTIVLPNRLPYGTQVPASSFGRILAIVDPENTVNETGKSNNDTQSAPVTLKLLWGGTASVVPTSPPIRTSQPTATTTTPTVPPPTITPQDAAKQARYARTHPAQSAKAAKAAKDSLAATIANELKAHRAAAARARAAKAAAAHAKKGNSLVRAAINYQNNTNKGIVNLLKLLK